MKHNPDWVARGRGYSDPAVTMLALDRNVCQQNRDPDATDPEREIILPGVSRNSCKMLDTKLSHGMP